MRRFSGWAAFGAAPLTLAGCVPEQVPPQAATPPLVAPAQPACAEDSLRGADFRLEGEAMQGALMRGLAPRCARRVTLDGRDVPFAPDGRFLIAFDRDASPAALLRAEIEGGVSVERTLPVQAGSWRIERVDASPTANIPSAQFLERRKPELERIAAARAMRPYSDGWRQSFRWPITGRISGLFGAQRIYRGQPGSYHSGVDVAVPTGTPIRAPADGVVVLAAQTPFTLEGHLLIVDHGMGLTSAFLHCSSLAVKEGDIVRQGQVVAAVGATGRASGPHMHWGMMWNGARLDPQKIAASMQ